MRRRRSLKALQKTYDYRISRLSLLLASTDLTSADADRNLSYIAIECLNSWAAFIREYYLSCALFNARTIAGGSSGPRAAFNSEYDALFAAVAFLKPNILARVSATASIGPRDEPTWHEVSTIVRLSSGLNFSNSASVNAAFSYPTNVFRDAPVIRNFFAHRNAGTAEKVRRLVKGAPYFSPEERPHLFLASLLSGRPQSVISDWLDDLRLVSHELCL